MSQLAIIGADRQFIPLRLSELRTDTYGLSPQAYQREISQAQVNAIVLNFQEELRKDTVVSRRVDGDRAGQHFIVDGQHTIAALKELYPDPEQRVMVSLRHWTRDQEAKAFLGQRENSRGISTRHNFRVALEHEEDWAVLLDETIRKAGAEIRLDGTSSGPNLAAIKAARNVGENWGVYTLLRTVEFLLNTYPDDRANLHGRLITGMAAFFTMYPKISNRELQLKLKNDRQLVPPTPRNMTAGGMAAPQITQLILNSWNFQKGTRALTYDRAALAKNGQDQLAYEALEREESEG